MNSLQDQLTGWDSLLTELGEMPCGISQVESCRTALETAAMKARKAKALQKAHRNAAEKATQQVHEAMAQGREAALRLRSFLKGCLGVHNEELVRFGVAPIRKRGPRRAAQPAADAG